MRALFFLVLLSHALAPAWADAKDNQASNELVTDRPDFTESGLVVPSGSVQIEGGGTWEKSWDDYTGFSGPEILVRWALRNRLELRFGLPDYIILRNDEKESGFGDSSVGAKIQLGPTESGWDVATILAASVPTGSSRFTSDYTEPEIILTVGRDLANPWSVGGQLMGAWPIIADEREFHLGATLVAGRSLRDHVDTFLELSATVSESGPAPISIHHGYTYLVGPHAQLDFHGGVGLTGAAPDVFLGLGVSVLH